MNFGAMSGLQLAGLYMVHMVLAVLGEESCMIQVQSGEKAASPVEYTSQMAGPVHTLVAQHMKRDSCRTKIPGQKMYFAGPGRCSIASADMQYLAHDKKMKRAKKGDIIEMNCDDVFCPIPVIADCYMSPGICAKDEWCWVRQHEKWGAWAMGPLPNGTYGHTPAMDYCATYVPAYWKALAKAQAQDQQWKIIELNRSLELLCPASSNTFTQAWRPIRGQCVKYRQEQQSCFQQQDLAPAFTGMMAPRFKLDDKGFPMERPLACEPTNLTCTAPNFNVLPSTCVQKRPPNICYYGPWWDSSDCPREHMKPQPGLRYDIAVNAMLSAALLFEGEVAWPGTCAYWDQSTEVGKAVIRVREQVYQISKDLWPYAVLKQSIPTLKTIQMMLPDPITYLMTVEHLTQPQAVAKCMKDQDIDNSTVAQILAKASTMASQPNKVWSLVHFFTFNLIDLPLTQEKALASQALATLLAQNFWCNDCRSFFQVGVIEQFGLPPVSGTGADIAHWWHHAHNVASEHVATTRAGHPWIHQIDALPEYQNPFYMSWDDAYTMWYVPLR